VQSSPRVEAIDRALQLLLALADAGPGGAPLAELAEAAGSNKSTAYRALSTLRANAFATQSPDTGHYLLGPAAMGLAARHWTPQHVATALHPALVALSREVDELVHLGVQADDQILYIDKVEPDRAIRVWSAVGQLAPAATTAMGRALLAARDLRGEHLQVYLRSLPEGSRLTVEELEIELAATRARGYSRELEVNEPGVACIGMAMLREDRPVCALSITTPAERMTARREELLAAAIHREVGPLLPEGFSLFTA
jgi:DNA-binding IclR family transcriptional regulator